MLAEMTIDRMEVGQNDPENREHIIKHCFINALLLSEQRVNVLGSSLRSPLYTAVSKLETSITIKFLWKLLTELPIPSPGGCNWVPQVLARVSKDLKK